MHKISMNISRSKFSKGCTSSQSFLRPVFLLILVSINFFIISISEATHIQIQDINFDSADSLSTDTNCSANDYSMDYPLNEENHHEEDCHMGHFHYFFDSHQRFKPFGRLKIQNSFGQVSSNYISISLEITKPPIS